MKKKLTLTNILITIASLTILFLVSLFSVKQVNDNNVKENASTYLKFAMNIYDGTNEDTLINYFPAANKIRITVIDYDGTVIADNFNQDYASYDNHLAREEIKNLGTIYYRYSESTSQDMVYLALKDDGHYLRISFPSKNVNKILVELAISGIITGILISLLSFIIFRRIIDISSKPLENEIKELSILVGNENNLECDDIETLNSNVQEVKKLLNDKIISIEEEKLKNQFIIDNIGQGFILFDDKLNILNCNNIALDIFKIEDRKENYLYFIRSLTLQKALETCLKEKENIQIEEIINDKKYQITLTRVSYKDNSCKAISMFVYDITKENKIQEMKQDFFANASHELKSPLTSIIGYQQMIDQGILTSEDEIKLATKKTLKEALRMNALIKDMLELSSLESETKTEISSTNIKPIILNSLSSLENRIVDKGIRVTTSLDDFKINIPYRDLEHLVNNLIENAVKYNKQQGTINIKLNKEDHSLIIQDTGIGIEKDNLDRVFERFYQVDKSHTKGNEGTGLGLSIVRHICLKYNVEIKLESEINIGSTFTLKFPS